MNQQVYRLPDEREAQAEFESTVAAWFTQRAGQSPWVRPGDIQALNLPADQHELRCSTDQETNEERCRFFARYRVFVMQLSADTSAVPHAEFTELIRAIDRRAVACLAAATPQP